MGLNPYPPQWEHRVLLGQAPWLKLPTLARHHSNHLHELFYDRSPDKEHRTDSHHQPEEFRKGQKETPLIQPPPRILPSVGHLGWTRRAPPGRTPTQNDWLKTTRKLSPSCKTGGWKSVGELFSWAPRPCGSPPGCLFPIKSLALTAHVSPQMIHFPVLDKSPVSGPGKDPPSGNITTGRPENSPNLFLRFSWYQFI